MDNQYRYGKAIVLGSGKLAHQCALVCREHLQDVEVLEYKVTDSTVLQKTCQKDRIPYTCCDKGQMGYRLEREEGSVLVVSAGNTFIIPEHIVEKENLTIVNWHNALLPRHKGRNAEAWSIYEGDSSTGITWHMISSQVDGGDIIVQREIPIGDDLTALELYQRQCAQGLEAFREIIAPLLEDRCALQKQRESGTGEMHFARDIPNGGYLDLEWGFEKASRFLRAMDYGALRLLGDMRVSWEGRCYRFHKYKLSEGSGADGTEWQDRDLVLHREGHEIRLRNLRI